MTDRPDHKVVTISTLVVLREGRMLLVRKEGATAFILPGGKIEPGESLEQAVRREVHEELGSEIIDLAYAATFRDDAADAPGVEIVVHVHVGHLASEPVVQAEIREMIWCSVDAPEVPVAPSLERQILGYFSGVARTNVRLTSVARGLRQRVTIGPYSDRHVAELLVQAGIALGEISIEDAPVERIVMPMRAKHAIRMKEERHALVEHDDRMALYARTAARDMERDEDEKRYDEDRRIRMGKERNQILAVVARGEAVEKRLRDDPMGLLLPLGTTVRIRPFELQPGDWPVPVAGTIGVVVGYSTLFSRPNVVAFPQDVIETDGGKVLFDEDEANRYHQVNYLPEELETLSSGQLVDGTPVERPGWWPTHSHHERGSILYNESMVVRAMGRLWRIQPCSELPECTQITLDTEEGRSRFNHLIPLDGQ